MCKILEASMYVCVSVCVRFGPQGGGWEEVEAPRVPSITLLSERKREA